MMENHHVCEVRSSDAVCVSAAPKVDREQADGPAVPLRSAAASRVRRHTDNHALINHTLGTQVVKWLERMPYTQLTLVQIPAGGPLPHVTPPSLCVSDLSTT